MLSFWKWIAWTSFFGAVISSWALGQETAADRMLADYFRRETAQLRQSCLADVQSATGWLGQRRLRREQLQEMLSLSPWPPKTPLQPVVTGLIQRDAVVVERIVFQSRPGLYVTANLYRPVEIQEPLPAILYVCGHGPTVIDGVSYGNKVSYQHHGAWFARNGYLCLVIDSLQLGEIEGIHHGTHRYDMWWWLCRGYTPAGVEAWNCIRALDYLQTRPEVDAQRIGVTGRSGGGAYSWWIAALDERVQVAAPVAGITDLQNHVVDGCVEGHCDCMFLINTYRWDYPAVAALVAPRPLLLSNTDRDSIFPLDGVVRTFEQTRRIYSLLDASEQLGLNISPGPHQDTQLLRVHAFSWFHRYLRQDDSSITDVADKRFEPHELKVLDALPTDERNSTAHEWFVAAADAPPAPSSPQQWQTQQENWRGLLESRVFRGWPASEDALEPRLLLDSGQGGVRRRAYVFTSQAGVELPLLMIQPLALEQTDKLELRVLDSEEWESVAAAWTDAAERFEQRGQSAVPADPTTTEGGAAAESTLPQHAIAYFLPRGIGLTAWSSDRRKQVQNRRRFYLLGQTLDGMRCWDVRRALQMIRSLDEFSSTPIELVARRQMAGVALYASLFEPPVHQLELQQLPASHREGPFLLNVQRFLDMPQVVAMAADRMRVRLCDTRTEEWGYVVDTARQLGWTEEQFKIVTQSAR